MCWGKIAFFLVNRDRGLEIHTFCQIDSVYQCVCVYLTRTHTRAFKLQQHWQLIHCEERIIMPWLRPTPHSTLGAHLWQASVPDPFSVITKYTYIQRYMGVTRAPLPRSCSFPFPSYSSSTCRQLV